MSGKDWPLQAASLSVWPDEWERQTTPPSRQTQQLMVLAHHQLSLRAEVIFECATAKTFS